MLGPVSTSAPACASATRAAMVSMLRTVRPAAPRSRGSAAIEGCVGSSSAVAARVRAWYAHVSSSATTYRAV